MTADVNEVIPEKQTLKEFVLRFLYKSTMIMAVAFMIGLLIGSGIMLLFNDYAIRHVNSNVAYLQDILLEVNMNILAVHKEVEKVEVMHKQLQDGICLGDQDITEQIQAALKNYDADKTGLIDYALESGGGRIVSTSGTVAYGVVWSFPILGSFTMTSGNPPETILRPSNQPGQCFAFAGNSAQIRIRLIAPIVITAVTMEHAPFDIAYDTRSAPKEFAIYGLTDDYDSEVNTQLGNFKFELDGNQNLQTFRLRASNMHFQVIELQVFSNHGHPDYTCIYRLRVHGTD